jgi:hypothetical protein
MSLTDWNKTNVTAGSCSSRSGCVFQKRKKHNDAGTAWGYMHRLSIRTLIQSSHFFSLVYCNLRTKHSSGRAAVCAHGDGSHDSIMRAYVLIRSYGTNMYKNKHSSVGIETRLHAELRRNRGSISDRGSVQTALGLPASSPMGNSDCFYRNIAAEVRSWPPSLLQ